MVCGRELGMSFGMAGAGGAESAGRVSVWRMSAGGISLEEDSTVRSSSEEGCSSFCRLCLSAFHFSASAAGGSSDSMRCLNESGDKGLTFCRRDDDSCRARQGRRSGACDPGMDGVD